MTDEQFRAFLDLLMVSDPWPSPTISQDLLTGYADVQAVARGFKTWIDAYHDFNVVKQGLVTVKQASTPQTSCNRHNDCVASEEKAIKSGRFSGPDDVRLNTFHCNSSDCEECFGY